MTTYNQHRIDRAVALINHYNELPSVERDAPQEQHLCDVLADLRHMAADHGLDFARALRISEMHFEAERADKDEDVEM